MTILAIINSFLILILIYVYFIHEYILGKRKFKCLRCGKCRKLRVVLPNEDIEKIKKAGYKDFLIGNSRVLKKVNGNCIFIKTKNGITSCTLENKAKPALCKRYPVKKGILGKRHDFRCRSFWN